MSLTIIISTTNNHLFIFFVNYFTITKTTPQEYPIYFIRDSSSRNWRFPFRLDASPQASPSQNGNQKHSKINKIFLKNAY